MIGVIELVIHEASDDTGFTHGLISQEDQLVLCQSRNRSHLIRIRIYLFEFRITDEIQRPDLAPEIERSRTRSLLACLRESSLSLWVWLWLWLFRDFVLFGGLFIPSICGETLRQKTERE
ncbi:hypothetical protein TorRG33x02_045740, partial [Trema orientale]